MNRIRKVAFVVNSQKSGASDVARTLAEITTAAGVAQITTDKFPISEGFLEDCDACCVIGGDGTLLGVVTEAAKQQVPVIGVNRGSLGFLTIFSAEEARSQFQALLAGGFKVAYRSLLNCSTNGSNQNLALNDVLIKEEVNSKLVHLEVLADGELVTDYYCDGLIFSTPTGSTAYNLSAGGPLIHPSSEVVAMTPICPHALTNRALIFQHDVKLRVINRMENAHLLVAMDGQRNVVVTRADPIEISISDLKLPLAQPFNYSHFQVVRTKLGWSGGAIDPKRSL